MGLIKHNDKGRFLALDATQIDKDELQGRIFYTWARMGIIVINPPIHLRFFTEDLFKKIYKA